MTRPTPAALLLAACAFALPALADEEPPVPASITFVVSSGFWEEAPEEEDGAAATLRRGYYKLIAERRADGTANIHLQQIEVSAEGPKIASSTVLEEFSALKPYVTDIRPENSTGITTEPGLFATVYLKTQPDVAEPEGWTVLIDDLGDIKVERATN